LCPVLKESIGTEDKIYRFKVKSRENFTVVKKWEGVRMGRILYIQLCWNNNSLQYCWMQRG
jgi:hypothetical protein